MKFGSLSADFLDGMAAVVVAAVDVTPDRWRFHDNTATKIQGAAPTNTHNNSNVSLMSGSASSLRDTRRCPRSSMRSARKYRYGGRSASRRAGQRRQSQRGRAHGDALERKEAVRRAERGEVAARSRQPDSGAHPAEDRSHHHREANLLSGPALRCTDGSRHSRARKQADFDRVGNHRLRMVSSAATPVVLSEASKAAAIPNAPEWPAARRSRWRQSGSAAAPWPLRGSGAARRARRRPSR
jgi:hypothetical protein